MATPTPLNNNSNWKKQELTNIKTVLKLTVQSWKINVIAMFTNPYISSSKCFMKNWQGIDDMVDVVNLKMNF